MVGLKHIFFAVFASIFFLILSNSSLACSSSSSKKDKTDSFQPSEFKCAKNANGSETKKSCSVHEFCTAENASKCIGDCQNRNCHCPTPSAYFIAAVNKVLFELNTITEQKRDGFSRKPSFYSFQFSSIWIPPKI
jgi:hypothetical protein